MIFEMATTIYPPIGYSPEMVLPTLENHPYCSRHNPTHANMNPKSHDYGLDPKVSKTNLNSNC